MAGSRVAMGLYPTYMDLFFLPSPALGKCTQSQAAELAPSAAQGKLGVCHVGGTCCQPRWEFGLVGRGGGFSPQVWVNGAGYRDHLVNGLANYSGIGKSSGTPRDSTASSDPGWR